MIWIVAGMLSVIIAGFLALPLIRGVRAGEDRAEYDLRVYKDQLRELDRDEARGVIAEAEATAARIEIQRRILATDEARQQAAPDSKGAKPILLAFVVAAPISAMIFYGMTGSPGVPDFPFAARDLPPSTTAGAPTQHPETSDQSAEVASIQAMVGSLLSRLEAQPNDVDGWILLARSYVTLDRYTEAADAYKTALPLANNVPELMADYAEVLVMANGGEIVEQARQSFDNVLKADAANPKARFYLGMHKAQNGDVRGALQNWIDLITIGPAAAPWMPAVRGQIERAAEELGVSPADIDPSAEALAIASRVPQSLPALGAGAPVSPAEPGPGEDDVRAASEMSAEDRNVMIQSMIQQLADRLEENPNDRAGWQRLERAYTVLGETEKAADANARAAESTQ